MHASFLFVCLQLGDVHYTKGGPVPNYPPFNGAGLRKLQENSEKYEAQQLKVRSCANSTDTPPSSPPRVPTCFCRGMRIF
jgi:hypothetical protein